MLSFNQLIFFSTLFFISSCNNVNEYKRIRGSALGTSYSIIVDTKVKEHLLKEKIDSIFEVVNNSMSTSTASLIYLRCSTSLLTLGSSVPENLSTNHLIIPYLFYTVPDYVTLFGRKLWVCRQLNHRHDWLDVGSWISQINCF